MDFPWHVPLEARISIHTVQYMWLHLRQTDDVQGWTGTPIHLHTTRQTDSSCQLNEGKHFMCRCTRLYVTPGDRMIFFFFYDRAHTLLKLQATHLDLTRTAGLSEHVSLYDA